MDLYEYEMLLKELSQKSLNIKEILNVDSLELKLKELESSLLEENIWMDLEKINVISKEKSKIFNLINSYNNMQNELNDCILLFDMAKEENDEVTLNELYDEAENLKNLVLDSEINVMLNDEHDEKNAIFSIQPGAGGTESQDWGIMLYRMYLRYANKKGFKIELLDYQEGEEAGIKGASFIVKGINAYGYLKNESGVHRLVRNSPFDSNDKRHTSFASIQVSPELDDEITIEIDDKDLRIDTYRSSGAGGQHVNKTESAVRITHIPSNIVVQCQNDRSQHKNKATALKMLKSKLYILEKNKQNQNIQLESGSNSWGHQIRNYVLTPYQQVKDLRSNFAISNTQSILGGDLDSIIQSVLVFVNKKIKNK